MVKIYGLICPVSKKIRYIGKTKWSLDRRLKEHMRENKKKTHKQKWINLLKTKGLTPTIVLIENVNEDNWIEKEKFYIKLFKENGFNLTNISDGGEGGGSKGYKHSKEWKIKDSERMRIRMKNNPFDSDYYSKLSEGKKKKVVRIDKDGLKKQYESIAEASKELVHLQKDKSLKKTCTSISNCLNLRSKTAYGYAWNYL